jgi:hypothetical protein
MATGKLELTIIVCLILLLDNSVLDWELCPATACVCPACELRIGFFFLFPVLGLELRAFTLSHSTSPVL